MLGYNLNEDEIHRFRLHWERQFSSNNGKHSFILKYTRVISTFSIDEYFSWYKYTTLLHPSSNQRSLQPDWLQTVRFALIFFLIVSYLSDNEYRSNEQKTNRFFLLLYINHKSDFFFCISSYRINRISVPKSCSSSYKFKLIKFRVGRQFVGTQ